MAVLITAVVSGQTADGYDAAMVAIRPALEAAQALE
jgi:hypothetical protein